MTRGTPTRHRNRVFALTLLIAVMSAPAAVQDLTPLVVEEILPNSAAAKAGVHVGDRLVSYDGKALPSPAALLAAEENTFNQSGVALRVQRGDETLALTAPLGTLGIQVHPVLPSAALTLYEDGRAAQKAKKPDDVITAWTAAAKAAQEAGDTGAAAWLYWRVGGIHEGRRQWKEGIEAYAAAWDLLKQGTDAAAQSRTLLALGRCHENVNDFPVAKRWHEQAEQVDTAAGNEIWAAGDFTNLGIVTFNRGDLAGAQDYFERALRIRERLAPNSLDGAASLNNLGNVVRERGDLAAAHDYHSRALAIRERLAPNSLDVAMSLTNLASIAANREDLTAQQEYHSRALAIKEKLAPNS